MATVGKPRPLGYGQKHGQKSFCNKKHNDFNLRQMTGKKPIPDGLLVRQFPMISEVGGRP
jgi:hypothetical protein